MSRQESIPAQPEFGRRLRALRLARGLSQFELAGTEISAAYLSRLESGTRPPTPRVLSHLCAQLDVLPAVFRARIGSPLAQALAKLAAVGDSRHMARELEDALQEDGDGDASLRWQALWSLARCHQAEGRPAEELRVLTELVALGSHIGQPDLQTRALIVLARRRRAAGEHSEAFSVASEAYNLAVDNDLPQSDIAEVQLMLVSLEAERGRLLDARARVDRVVGSLSADAPVRLQVEALWTAATVAVRQGDGRATAEFLRRALERMPSNEDPVLWMRLRLAAASMYLQMEPRDTERARIRLREAAPAAELVGLPLHQRELLILQCQLAFHEGDFAEARALSDRIGEDPEGVAERDRLALTILRNQLDMVDGDRLAAVVALERIAKDARESGDPELAAEVWRALAESLSHAESAPRPQPQPQL